MSTAVISAILLGLASPEEAVQEPLPPPAVLAVMPGPMPPPLGTPALPLPPWADRPSAYEHWQYRATSTRGFMRPRVIYGPCGAYYAYDGRWYPWAFTGNGPFRP
jgi:hypothetical protein